MEDNVIKFKYSLSNRFELRISIFYILIWDYLEDQLFYMLHKTPGRVNYKFIFQDQIIDIIFTDELNHIYNIVHSVN